MNKVARYRGTDNDNIFERQPGYIYTNDNGVFLINQKREAIQLYGSNYLDEKLDGVVDEETIIQNITKTFGSAFHFKGSLENFSQLPSNAQNGDVYQIGDKEYAYNGSEFVELGFNIDLSEYAKIANIPTKISDLQNDAGYLTEHQDISGKANISDVYTKEQADEKFLTEHQDISGKVDKEEGKGLISSSEVQRLANVNNYDDTEIRNLINSKSDASSVYTKNESDAKYLTSHQSLTEYAKTSDLPTKVSDLQNDAGYLTEHQDISGKANISDVYTKEQADEKFLTEHQDISGKVDKIQGKSLVDDIQIARLSQVTNYDDTAVLASINTKADVQSVYNKTEIDGKIDEAKRSITPSNIIKNIKIYNDIEYNQQGFVANINEMTQEGIYIIDSALGHTPTPVQDDKGLLIVTQNMQQFISNKTETFGRNYFRYKDENEKYSGNWIASAMKSDLDEKVSKENGKGLSSNDFTNAYKTKLDSLNNYDDSEIRLQVSEKANSNDVYTSQQTDEKISEAIANLESLASGALHFKGIKASVQEIQAIPYNQASVGDVWQVGSKMYACNKKENSQLEWIELGISFDLSAYAEKENVYTKLQVDTKITNIQSQIGNISAILNNIIG